MMHSSKLVDRLPVYLFSIFQKKKQALQAQGIDVIDLGIGAPDLPTPPFIIDRLVDEVHQPANHKYSPYSGCEEFRQAVADFYEKRYDVQLDPETEVLALIGSKEGLAHMLEAVIDPGDGVLMPDPGYPVYQSAIHLAHGVGIKYRLYEESGYKPLFERLLGQEDQRLKLMLMNYPNNPTGATVERKTFEQAVTFARNKGIFLIQDAAYDLVTFGSYRAPSILQVEGAKEVAVEFGSLSKSFNMSGWRIGYVVGNARLIQALSVVKSNKDTGQFLPIQKAAATALQSDLSEVIKNNCIYEKRLEMMMGALESLDMRALKPKGTLFIWAKVPAGETSAEFCEKMLDNAGVIITPGTAFGEGGEGYVRISLSVPLDRLEQAVIRMKKARKGGSV
ncbi:aminotransferase class I/II-fold pyridoxal phosphate-dependent enzyme [Halobacillus sp. ACCC02827]|uniref:aminotransferase class I/II-fold pyridoxal phosphate-dependent enzyme n=1 Tax=Halobacillus sp. ACCC02827 TaxID=3052090 RepID=UPI00256FEFC9|nr:aminotransferase class I/II-fold pyridoxal phosphate-dependent enzyme [Halobacillus sp. ACCC02827]WJE14220.1 aminotransferase class I/II-fold pyridoxal phosphate-dependent enzyme [Halobacillus sp. ACCC02827]